MFRLVFFCLLIFIAFGCELIESDSKNKKDESKTIEIKYASFPEHVSYDDFLDSVNKRKDLIEVSSLSYSDSIGNEQHVIGFVDKTFSIVKLTHEKSFINGKSTKTIFYFNGAKKIISQHLVSIFKENKSFFQEINSYYNSKNKVIYSAKRVSFNESILPTKKFIKTNSIAHNEQEAKELINQKEDFQTNFHGFMQMHDKIYLIVGTKKYSSTIAFQEYTGLLKRLKNNENHYLNKLLKVEFDIMNEANGFTFQVLKDVKLID
jgi:hypothetical protein